MKHKTQNLLQNLINDGDNFMITDNPTHTMNFLYWQDADIMEITLRTIGRNPAADDNIPNFPSFEPPIERLGPDETVISRLSFESGLINMQIWKPMNVSYNRSRLSLFSIQPVDSSSPAYCNDFVYRITKT